MPFVEAAVAGSDERTDRGRTLPPHISGVLFERRFHIEAADLRGEAAAIAGSWRNRGLVLCGMEAVRFIEDKDAEVLQGIHAGDYPELFTGLIVLHLRLPSHPAGGLLAEFSSRSDAAQELHREVGKLIAPVASLRRETVDRRMDPSELPFVLVASLHEDAGAARDRAHGMIGRSPESAVTQLAVAGWEWSLWSGAAAVSADRQEADTYRFNNRASWVASSVILDAVLLRFAQYHALGMLARRTADGAIVDERQARALHHAALRIRSRVWWRSLSTEPFIAVPTSEMARIWDLEGLAEGILSDASGLAQHADLVAAERLNRVLSVLTGGALGVASVSLAVQVVTSSQPLAAAVAAAAAAAAAGAGALLARLTILRSHR